MPKNSEKKVVPISSIRDWIAKLRSFAAACEASCDAAEELGHKELEVGMWPTGELGLEKITKFGGALFTAVSASVMKKTLNSGAKSSQEPAKKGKPRKKA